MRFTEEFRDAIGKYWKLMLAWTTAELLLVAANYSLAAFSYSVAVVLFVLGAVNLAGAGISCAYVIARDAQ